MQSFPPLVRDAGGHSSDNVIRRSLQAVREHLGMEVAYLSEFVDGEWVLRAMHAGKGVAPLDLGDRLPLDDTYCYNVVQGRLPQVIPDAAGNPLTSSMAVTDQLSIGSHITVPIHRDDGSLYGAFCCMSSQPNVSLNARDLKVMEMFADLSAEHINTAITKRVRHADITARIRQTLDAKDFGMVFQPIFELSDGQASGFEALARFRSAPYRTPDIWFAEAESVGLGLDLELAAIAAALPALHGLPEDVYLAVNAAPSTAASGRLVEIFADYPHDRIVLEITEHALAQSDETLLKEVQRLRVKGVQLAIDDAGAGYSGLAQIARLSPDIIKLDRSLVTDINAHRARHALAAAMVHFAGGSNAILIAEGVETKNEFDSLRELGVHRGQGWLFGKPANLEIARECMRYSPAA